MIPLCNIASPTFRESNTSESQPQLDLKRLTFKGSPAVLVDRYCGTGDTHSVEIYAWKKVFSTYAPGPVRLNTERGAFKSMDLRVFAGDHGCPESDRPRVACDVVVRWNGTAFTYDLVGVEKP